VIEGNDTITEIPPSFSPGELLLITIHTPLFENGEVRFV